MTDPKDTHPTPASGMPAAVAATSIARPSVALEEISAPKSDGALAILAALNELRADVQATRKETRERGEETAKSIARIDKKVDKLAVDDDELRLAQRRLEQRQASTDEEVRLLREDMRKEREARTEDKTKMGETFDAMKRFVEDSAKASTSAVDQVAEAAARFDAASAKFDTAANDIEAVKAQSAKQDEHNAKQDSRLDTIDSSVALIKGTQDRVANELGLVPVTSGSEIVSADKEPPGHIRTLTRQQKISALLIVAVNLSASILVYLLTRH